MAWTGRFGGWVVAMACGGALGACGGGTTDESADASSPGDDAGGLGDSTTPLGDGGGEPMSCSAVDAGLSGYETPAGGTVAGSDVSASVCGASAFLFESRYTTPSNDYLLFLNSTMATAFSFQSPTDASYGLLTGSMMISAPAPGVYPSAGACGFLGFSYALPVPAGVDCGDTTGPTCPTGCSTVCSGQGCEPCMPTQPEVDFDAAGVSDCLGNATTVAGSWTVTLTSVEPYTDTTGDDNGPHFIVHGSVTATIPAGEGGTGSVTLTMGF